MRVLVIDVEQANLDFVLRLVECGHEIRWYRWCKPGKHVRSGEGFKGFTVVDDWRPHMKWAKDGLIVVTGNFVFLKELDRYRTDFGFKIFGPTFASARLETERGVGMETFRAAGIDVPPYEMFDTLEDAEARARKGDRCFVFKPTGDEEDKSLTFVSRDPADMVGWLGRQIARGKKLKGKCMLQEKISGVQAEIGVSAWMGPEGFLPDRFHVCFEGKPLMNDDIGPATGEQHDVAQYVEHEKLAEDMLLPLEPICRALGHTGDTAIGAMIDNHGKAWPLEFSMRLGYPQWYQQTAAHHGDPAQWMLDLINGKDSLRVSYDTCIGVVLTLPPFPFGNGKPELIEGDPIEGIDEAGRDAHLIAVMRGKGPMMRDGEVVDGPIYQTTDTYTMCMTGLGKDIETARKRVYKAVDKIHFPQMMYRTDAGCKVIKSLPTLNKFGYATEIKAGSNG